MSDPTSNTEPQVIEIAPEKFFNSREDIEAFNRQNFPQNPEPKYQPTPKDVQATEADGQTQVKAALEKRLFALGGERPGVDSSSTKVAMFREKLNGLKAGLVNSRGLDQPVSNKAGSSFSTIRTLVENVELMASREQGQVDESILIHRPSATELTETMDSIIEAEQQKQAVILEFLPDPSNIKSHLLPALEHIENSVRSLEHILGRESRLANYSYELEGMNMRTAVVMMLVTLTEDKCKGTDKTAEELINLFNNKIRVQAQSKINQEAVKISIEKVKQITDLYELFKGLVKYEKVLDKSLLLYRSYEKISALRNIHPTDVGVFDVHSKELPEQIQQLKAEVTRVNKLLHDQLVPVHKELLEIEAQAKKFA